MFTYTQSERKWVRETMLYPLLPPCFIETKKSPKFLWNSFAVRTGLVTGLPLCLQRTLTPGHGESIYKKRRNLAVSSCGAYGTRTRDPLRDRQIF